MINIIKNYLNNKFNTKFSVEVMVSTPSHTASIATLHSKIKKDEILLLTSDNKVKYLICNDYIQFDRVYHLDTPEGIFIIRIL